MQAPNPSALAVVALSLSLSACALLRANAAPEVGTDPAPAALRPPGFFLVPPPAEKDRTALRDLLAGPLLDRSLILETAERLERDARLELVRRRREMVDQVCTTVAPNRPAIVKGLRQELEAIRTYSRAATARYDAALLLRVRQAIPSDKSRAPILEAYQVAARLRRERADLIHDSWDGLLEKLKHICPETQSRGLLTARLPTERLYGPAYLALYRFYAALPDGLRMDLITGLHGSGDAPTGRINR